MNLCAMKVSAALLLVVVLLFVVKADGSDNFFRNELKPQTTKETIAELSLNVSKPKDRYKAFMTELNAAVVRTMERPTAFSRVVLGTQKAKPDHWVYVKLIGHGPGQSTLAIRLDNLYLVGFKVQGRWYAFKGKDDLIQGSTALPFTDDYRSLTDGGGSRDLNKVVVGKKSAQEALNILASYRSSTPEKDIKQALLRFVLMLCEAARLLPIREDVIAAWDNVEGGEVRDVAVCLTVQWRFISCALLGSSKGKNWKDIPDAQGIPNNCGAPKIESPETAAANVYYILQKAGCPYNK